MPKIQIKETVVEYGKAPEIDNTVFIPIQLDSKNTKIEEFGPVLIKTKAELKGVLTQEYPSEKNSKVLEEASVLPEGDVLTESYLTKLLEAGLQILLYGVKELSADDPIWGMGGISDKSLYDIRFITAGLFEKFKEAEGEGPEEGEGEGSPEGLSDEVKLNSLYSTLLEVAEKRGDAIALLDAPKEIEVSEGELISEHISKLFEGVDSSEESEDKRLLGSFGASFAPWVRVGDEKSKLVLPGSFAYLVNFAKSINRGNPSHLAIAGPSRGALLELTPIETFGTNDIDILQKRTEKLDPDKNEGVDNVGVAVNPIAPIRPYGPLIWGNRTLHKNKEDKELPAVAFLNVRNLVCDLKKVLYSASRSVTFEQNSNLLWAKFTSFIYPTLDEMVSSGGITGYKLTKEKTDKKARLSAKVIIYPVEAVEDFEISVVIDKEGDLIVE